MSWLRPQLNWDMLAYIALVRSWQGEAPAAAHAAAYADADGLAASRGLGARAAALRDGPYRAATAADAATFAEQMPFYRIRPLYLAGVAAVSRLTGSIAAATVAVSVFSVVLCGLGLLWFAAWRLGVVPGSAVAALFVLSPPVSDAASLSTPDALVTLVAGAGALLLVLHRPLAAAALLLAGVMVRTDLQVFNLCLAAGCLAVPRFRLAAAVLAASVPLAAAVNAWAGNYGYPVLYRFTFIDPLVPHPAGLQGLGIPFKAFVQHTALGVRYSLENGGLWPVLVLLAACGALTARWRGPAGALLLAVAGSTVLRLLLFPSHDVRMNAPAVAMLAVLLVELAKASPRRCAPDRP